MFAGLRVFAYRKHIYSGNFSLVLGFECKYAIRVMKKVPPEVDENYGREIS
jgi:hypothetical protein